MGERPIFPSYRSALAEVHRLFSQKYVRLYGLCRWTSHGAAGKTRHMRLVNWNIQWGRGVDGSVDLRRIVDQARDLADFDVLCLQEVTRGFDGGQVGGGLPADPTVASMPRVAVEAVLLSDVGPLRVTTTHLEYYSAAQRLAQAHALRALHIEACGHAVRPSPHGDPNSPFAPVERPCAALVCGDFNSATDDPAYLCMLDSMPSGVPSFMDAWLAVNGQAQRAPTVGVHDHAQWPQGPFTCDFVFVTPDLATRLTRCEVEQRSAASDHQPIVVELR
jgi:endonuclease/exonuclease/phosphatase family metal-dependent hydrolase